MSNLAIRAEKLGKSYQIAHSTGRGGYKTLQEDMLRLLRRPFSKDANASKRETFWALRDVSFELQHGEVLGIIGRNGAGKSTLLKILSRITKPTTGRADIYGRIGSLLEVGTGFHPELTGRENIFLNGAVLGMTRRDIQKHFDEIVAFAEVEQFLDTPVKRYSSGMYMRLAFAVAAHLEPEVLVVDEVLAVGDAEFQKKCLGKMSEVAKGGRTVLFVSHNMAAVESLCTRAIVLERGTISFSGKPPEAIQRYTSYQATGKNLNTRLDRKGRGDIRINSIELRDEAHELVENARSGQEINICFNYNANPEFKGGQYLYFSIAVKTMLGMPVFVHHNRLSQDAFSNIPAEGTFVCKISRLPLTPSQYSVSYEIRYHDDVLEYLDGAFDLDVLEGNFYASGEVPPSILGVCLVDARWSVSKSPYLIGWQ